MIRIIALIVLGGLLFGCVTPLPTRPESQYRPVLPTIPELPQPTDGSLFIPGNNVSLFYDRRAWQVGDIITVVLEEQTSASKTAETTLTKETTSEIPNPSLLGNLVRGSRAATLLNEIDSETEFEGSGEADQSNSLTGTISVLVTGVLANGLLQIQGEKWFKLNQGEEFVRVAGLVRAEDVDGANNISSQRIADARIDYSGTGSLAQTNSPGWLARFFLGTVFPF